MDCVTAVIGEGEVRCRRSEADTVAGRPVQTDTLRTRTACQTREVPPSTLKQMLARDSFVETATRRLRGAVEIGRASCRERV